MLVFRCDEVSVSAPLFAPDASAAVTKTCDPSDMVWTTMAAGKLS